MPIYEYRCLGCKRKVQVFFRSYSTVNQDEARCPHCGSHQLTRLFSRVRVIRGASMTSDGDIDD